jgi:AcrR family transcriptional regulator
MPKFVDHDARRSKIIDATLQVLAERGPAGLRFRTVADRIGGSSTMVTHYYGTRQELLDSLIENLASWPEEVSELEAGADNPRDRLRLFLRWLLPCDERGLLGETARINLIGERDILMRTEHLFAAWDQHVRGMLTKHVEDLVPSGRVQAVVDVLRSTTNGITLSTVERPHEWPRNRQFAILDEVLAAFGFLPEEESATAQKEV